MNRLTQASNDGIDTDSFWKNGYLLIRGVFTPTEIAKLRGYALQSASHKGDLLSNPSLRGVIVDPRILRIAHAILGETPVYFGDSTCLIGDKSHGYHKDNADRDDINAPDWQSKYTLLRFGLYLQDHSTHSGGLNIRVKSHNVANTSEGRNIYLRTKPGDLAVWNLRTSHSGSARLFRFVRNLQLEPDQADRLPRFLFERAQAERAALFWSYGLNDHHLRRFITYLKTRTYAVTAWKNSQYGPDVWESVKGRDLSLRDLPSEIQNEADLGKNQNHVAIPY